MSDADQMTESAELRELRDSLSGIAVPERPRLEAIMARGRARRRRRLSTVAGLSVAGAVAGYRTGTRPDRRYPGPVTASGPCTRHDPDRVVQVRQERQWHGHADHQPQRAPRPAALQSDLAKYGIPAKVTVRQLLLLRSRAVRLFAGRVLAAGGRLPLRPRSA